jgi:hypothetical protein
MELPQGIDPEAAAVREEVVARRLALRPVAQVVDAQDAERPAMPTSTPSQTRNRSRGLGQS